MEAVLSACLEIARLEVLVGAGWGLPIRASYWLHASSFDYSKPFAALAQLQHVYI